MFRKPRIVCLAISALLITIFVTNVIAFSDGYIVAGTYGGTKTYLFDKDLNIVHMWDHIDLSDNKNGYSCYLLENGNLLRSGQAPADVRVSSAAAPRQGTISEIDKDGNVIWHYVHADAEKMMHHDFKALANGNIIGVSFLTLSKDNALAAGFDPELFNGGGSIWGGSANSVEIEEIFELQPDRTGGENHQIVWEWKILDHLVPVSQDAAAHPERFSGYLGPFFAGQWMHLNGLDYNPVKDLIVFTSRVFSEIYVIDHSTSTAEAATSTGGNYGKGGDILYRWGRPSNYLVKFEYDTTIKEPDTIFHEEQTTIDRRTGETTVTPAWTEYIPADTTISRKQIKHEQDYINCLHCPTWIPEGYEGAGDIMFFHNNVDDGMSQLGQSQAVQITPAVGADGKFMLSPGAANGPAAPTWVYNPGATDSMFSASMSSAIRMKNGNTIIHEAYPGGNRSGNASTVREVNQLGEVVWGPVTFDPTKGDTTEPEEPTTGFGGGALGAGFNPAKIMYYPSNYPGVVNLLALVGTRKEINTPNISHQPKIRRNANRITFTNVAGTEISIFSLQGRRVAHLYPKTGTFSYSTATLSTGTWLVSIKTINGSILNRMASVNR